MKKVLVTGGSGFLGRHLVEALLAEDYKVCGLDLQSGPVEHENLDWVTGSFLDSETLEAAVADCDAVFHLASTTLPKSSNENPGYDVASNLQGAVKLLDLAVANNVAKVVFISSGGTVYGVPQEVPVTEQHVTNPTCSYGIVKLAIEKYLYLYHQLHGLETCSLRLSNPYGEYQRADTGQGVIAAFCHKALNDQPIEIWGDGSVVRDFIYVKDAVDAMLKASEVACGGQAINIGSGQGFSLNAVIDQIEATSGVTVRRDYKAGRGFDVPAIYLDIAEAERVLDWRPRVTMSEGLQRLFSWAQQKQ
ncbi:MAG: UDP-glucose 4-epimerase [Halieaceae bacterium]|jgi:UDP-glucose 4-epimerase